MSATAQSTPSSEDGTAPIEAVSNLAELEAGGPPEKGFNSADPDLVDWDGPDDKANPQNWTVGKKWLHIVIVSLFALVTCVVAFFSARAGVG